VPLPTAGNVSVTRLTIERTSGTATRVPRLAV
jgi:hypothetical protein